MNNDGELKLECKKNGEHCDTCFDKGYKEGWMDCRNEIIEMSKKLEAVLNYEENDNETI